MTSIGEVRLGHIEFINCLPLAYGLSHGFGEGIDIVTGPPAMLNKMVMEGQLDISPVSSIVFAKHSEQFVVLPDVSISANGYLQSILLVSKRPIAKLDDARLALTSKSATSHALLKIIMNKAYQVTPEYYISTATTQSEALTQSDAALFIGDDALYAYHNRLLGCYYYDIGREWQKLTGQGMVYALWVANREFASKNPDLLQMVYKRITNGFKYGLGRLEAAADTISEKVPFTSEQITDYLKLLKYKLEPDYQEALLTYYKLASELELIADIPDLTFAEVR